MTWSPSRMFWVRLAVGDIGDTRRRNLRSAVTTYAKLVGKEPALIPLDLADLRRTQAISPP